MNRVEKLTVITITSLCLLSAATTMVCASVQPGDIITIDAVLSYRTKSGQQTSNAQCTLIVYSTVPAKRPVYVTNAWRREVSDEGETIWVFSNPMTDGMLVRGFVKDSEGDIHLVDGIQTTDGKILVEDVAYERVIGPGG